MIPHLKKRKRLIDDWPETGPASHQRWCDTRSLFDQLFHYQSTKTKCPLLFFNYVKLEKFIFEAAPPEKKNCKDFKVKFISFFSFLANLFQMDFLPTLFPKVFKVIISVLPLSLFSSVSLFPIVPLPLFLSGVVFLNKISADLLEISGFCVWLQEHGEMFGH